MAAHSPVELVVVVMRLPPEVEPDKQQTEGEEEDEGPQKLPLQEKKKHVQKQDFKFYFNSRAAPNEADTDNPEVSTSDTTRITLHYQRDY